MTDHERIEELERRVNDLVAFVSHGVYSFTSPEERAQEYEKRHEAKDGFGGHGPLGDD